MLNIWIHWIFASAFVGGFAFYLLIYQAHPFPEAGEEGRRWERRLEKRFRTFRWVCLLVLLGTGILNLINGEVAARISSSFGVWLLAKLFLVAVLLGLTGIYDSGLNRRLSAGGRNNPTLEKSFSNKPLAYGILTIGAAILLITLNF